MIKRLLLVSLLSAWLTPAYPVESYSMSLGVALPKEVTLKQTQEKLNLNGHAVVTMWGQETYVGALYTPYIEKRVEMLILNDEPLAMMFYFVRDDITPHMLSKAFTEAILVNNGGWDNKKLDRTRIMELIGALKQNMNAGDVLAFYYSPKNGVLMVINDEIQYHWPHAKSFFNVLLRMWVGPYPPSRGFKRAILNFPINK